MFPHYVALKPKYRKRFEPVTQNAIGFDVPDSWHEFAPLCKIRSGTRYISFKPYYYQSGLVDLIEARRNTIIVKTRQLGLSEVICNYFIWKALRNPAYVALIFSKTQDDTTNLAKRIKESLDPFTSAGLLKFDTDNVKDIEIAGGGRLLFRNSSSNGARGVESVSDVLFDEWAFVENAQLIYDVVMPTMELVGDDARVIVNSTPNGRFGHYWGLLGEENGKDHDIDRICQDVREGAIAPFQHWVDEDGANKVVIHWKAHPIHSTVDDYLEKKRKQTKMSKGGIQREYNLSFDASDQSVFAYEDIEAAAIGDYSEADKELFYYIGIDTSTIGKDYTVAIVIGWDGQSYSVAGMYRKQKASKKSNIKAIGELIEQYKPLRVGIEVTGGVGQIYLEELTEDFPSIRIEGIKTTGDSKPLMVGWSVMAHEDRIITYPIGPISDEHKSFIRDAETNKLEASPGAHDDTVMALAFALMVSPLVTEEYPRHIEPLDDDDEELWEDAA